jgi:rubrerythrin
VVLEMAEPDLTASEIISFAENLEYVASNFYKELAERYPANKETFLSFAKESEVNKLHVTRTYQETITDALEACFSFQDLMLKNYATETTLKEGEPYLAALRTAINMEEKAAKFYLDVAERCKSLLATIPNAFKKVSEKRNKRRLELKSMLDKASV